MKTKQLTTGVIGFVELPEDVIKTRVDNNCLMVLFYGDKELTPYKELPSGSWQIIEPTEEVLVEVMPYIDDNGLTKYFDFIKGYHRHSLFTALESFQTLKQSLGIDESKRYVVLF